jgi:UDP-N-acetylmuramoyl-tripeptide--D-alanyl-D-alanine ligase
MMQLSFVLEALTPYQPTGREPVVAAFVIDSRQAEPGSLFVAFVGERVDGHDYVGDAFQRGAIAALVEKPVSGDHTVVDARQPITTAVNFEQPLCILVDNTMLALQRIAAAWRAQLSPRIVGITGSVGKTTSKELVHAVLSQRGLTLKAEGSYNNEIGLPLTLLKLRPEHQYAVLEMGMYARGEIALLCELARPQVGVLTIVGPVHLERLGSIEAIAAAKQELVEALPSDPEGVAILNRDDVRVMAMAAHTQARVFTYGLDETAELWADDLVSMGLDGIRFTLHHGRHSLRNISVPLLGRHSVHTALRAAAVGLVEGLSWEEIITGLQGLSAQLRLVAVPGPQGSVIIDDTYNSSPESAFAALNLLAELDGRRLAILGDMLELGSYTVEAHQLVGRRACLVADLLVAVGELGRLIGESALQAGMPAAAVSFAEDAQAAIPLLEKLIAPGDMVLIKGSRGARLDRLVTALSRD